MLRMRMLRRLGLIIFSFFITSCHRVPNIGDYMPQGILLSAQKSNSIREEIKKSEKNYQTLRILSDCLLTYDEQHYRFRYAFVARNTDQLRIEQFPTRGFYALSTLVRSNGMTKVFAPEEKEVFIFDRAAEGLEHFLGFSLPLSEQELGLILTGILPEHFLSSLSRYYERATIGYEIQSDSMVAILDQQFRLNELHLFDKQERETLSIIYSYTQEVVPSKFQINIAEHQVNVACQNVKRSFNTSISDDLFDIHIPHGYRIKDYTAHN